MGALGRARPGASGGGVSGGSDSALWPPSCCPWQSAGPGGAAAGPSRRRAGPHPCRVVGPDSLSRLPLALLRPQGPPCPCSPPGEGSGGRGPLWQLPAWRGTPGRRGGPVGARRTGIRVSRGSRMGPGLLGQRGGVRALGDSRPGRGGGPHSPARTYTCGRNLLRKPWGSSLPSCRPGCLPDESPPYWAPSQCPGGLPLWGGLWLTPHAQHLAIRALHDSIKRSHLLSCLWGPHVRARVPGGALSGLGSPFWACLCLLRG